MPGARKKYNKNRSKRPRELGEKKYDENGILLDDRNTEAGKKFGYKDIIRENKKFEEFYKAQEICPEQEFEQMIQTLQSDLPSSFRITGNRSHAKSLMNVIKGEFFKEFTDCQAKGGKVCVPECIEWYPDQLAYQLNVTRKDIRREEIYFKLHNFLIAETESGNTSRQETVSMIPPLVLDVKPHHKVLDMCAAPGSKTSQLIEALHQDEKNLPTGLLVANDADNSRCYMLTHQAKRLQSPCFLITNHDASIMPKLYVPDPDSTDIEKPNKTLRFDRILCDVPCTGDGTMRKNPDIWQKWNACNGANLHGIQFRILKRGIELLEVGGRIVYSTCSLNPVEDEAVVARMLLEAEGSVELIHIADTLPGLKHNTGVSNWINADKKGNLYKSIEEVPKEHKNLIRPHMFPPTPEQAKNMHLDKCIRILPHQQNTGGFFVALLEKKALCPWEKQPKTSAAGNENEENAETKSQDGDEDMEGKEPAKKKPKIPKWLGFREDPYVYVKEEDPIGPIFKSYYGLELSHELLLSRNKDADEKLGKNLYFTTKVVKDIVENNKERVKIINTGVKAFTKCEHKGSTCDYRLAQEGVLMMLNHITKRKLYPSKDDMERMLLNSDFDTPPDIADMTADFRDQMSKICTGSVAIIYTDKDVNVEVVGWKGKNSIRAYVPKNERVHYLRLIGGDITKFDKNKFEEKKAKEESAAKVKVKEEKEKNETDPATVEDAVVNIKHENGLKAEPMQVS